MLAMLHGMHLYLRLDLEEETDHQDLHQHLHQRPRLKQGHRFLQA
jgi:hypothetical protein